MRGDAEWMLEALGEAERGGWAVHPNPMVGAVVVRDGEELGRGYHKGVGMPHAEVEACRDAASRGNDVRGATLYVTLEPCNHYGHTPPCTEAIISSGIRRVVMGTLDPNGSVSGGGLKRLRDAGVECSVGVCADMLERLNRPFFTRMCLGRPFITCKWAMTLDGKIATRTMDSKWVTSELARGDVHVERGRHDAIMVGTGTVASDNPRLNVRFGPPPRRQPLRVVIDRTLRLDPMLAVFDTSEQNTVLFTNENSIKTDRYTSRGINVEYVGLDAEGRGLDISKILSILALRYDITTLYCEGGAGLLGTLNDMRVIDRTDVYVAPKVTGGSDALGCIGGRGAELMNDSMNMTIESVSCFGPDIRIRSTSTVPNFGISRDPADTAI